MEYKNLLFIVQPSEVLYTNPMKTMKTYMNRFIIDEDDRVQNPAKTNKSLAGWTSMFAAFSILITLIPNHLN